MKAPQPRPLRLLRLSGLLLCLATTLLQSAFGEPPPAAISAFNAYCAQVEAGLAQRHRSPTAFLAMPKSGVQTAERGLRQGERIVEKLTPAAESAGGNQLRGALLHHWRGTVFVPNARAADVERVLRDFNAYPRYYAPEVTQAGIRAVQGDRMQAAMRVRQKHVIQVVMDTDYDIVFGKLDAQRGFSLSHSTRIAEIASPGTAAERALSPSEEHGFLWRLNTYWTYEERSGGVYLQIEAVSLTRAVPAGLGWAIGPFIESIPRESLEFTLRATADALPKR